MSGQYVVASYVLDVDSTLNATQPYSYSYSYYYQDARINLVGRGFLGYSAVTEADPQRQAVTTTTFIQEFPYQGKPLTRAVCQSSSAGIT
ncbi:MAG TPA: hypothetical protein VHN14_21225, partial [Kofleriaceae bacterium]|nr:hypothetical protein [Kofleriaceae bacterium]